MPLVNSGHIDGHLINQKNTASMESTSPNTTSRNSLRDLCYFPREIRDEIYRNVFPQYRVSYKPSIINTTVMEQIVLERFDDYGRIDWTSCKLSILRLSKAIKSEVMPIFYSKGTFRFYYWLQEDDLLDEVPQMPNVNFLNRMMNIEIIYHTKIGFKGTESTSNIYGAAPAGPLKLFQGANTNRNSIVIELIWGELAASYAGNMTKSPLFNSLRQLTRVKNVTLRFTTIGNVHCPPQGISRAQEKQWIKVGEWEKVYGGFTALFHAMSKDLEPTLGKSSAMSKLIPGTPGGSLHFSGRRAILFHPRDHQAKLARANKDTTNQEQSMGTTELSS